MSGTKISHLMSELFQKNAVSPAPVLPTPVVKDCCWNNPCGQGPSLGAHCLPFTPQTHQSPLWPRRSQAAGEHSPSRLLQKCSLPGAASLFLGHLGDIPVRLPSSVIPFVMEQGQPAAGLGRELVNPATGAAVASGGFASVPETVPCLPHQDE